MATIRTATVADARDLDAMVHELAAHEGSLEHVLVDAEGWRVLLARPEVVVLIAERDGESVGFVSTLRRLHLWSGGDVLSLDDLYVRPGHRDHGVGGALMRAVAELADLDGLAVQWGVRVDNHGGQRFYQRLGATLHTNMTVRWTPERYRAHLATTA